jgi:hypothetical protein
MHVHDTKKGYLEKNFAGSTQRIYFVFQSAFMNEQQQTLDTLQDIRRIMDRSSRFISLSGWSGVAAGTCALVGAWVAEGIIATGRANHSSLRKGYEAGTSPDPIPLTDYMGNPLVHVAVFTFMAALVSAFGFTWLRSKKTHVPLWGASSRRLSFAVGLPMATGGIYLLKLMESGAFGLIAPGCLLFYGLGLVNAARYTLGEIRWLGYAQILLGTLNLFAPGYGLYFWALGFGVLHIVYGLVMWWKYERG